MIASEPGETFEIVLRADLGKPIESRRTFFARHMSVREWKKFARIGDDWKDRNITGPGAADELLVAVATKLAGWHNAKDIETGESVAFALGSLEAIVTHSEAWELHGAILAGGRLSVDDAKKSASQSDTGTVDAATTASQAPA